MNNSIDAATIKRNIKISDIIKQDIVLKRKGSNYEACCPFHNDRTPSLSVVDQAENGGYYNCFGCGANGDVYQWLVNYRNMTFTEALEYLAGTPSLYDTAQQKQITLKAIMPVPKDARPLTVKDVHPQPRFSEPTKFCYRDMDGNLMMIILRYEEAKRDKSKGGAAFMPLFYGDDGYWHTKNFKCDNRPLYNLPALKNLPGKLVFIVAGEKKCDILQGVLQSNPVISFSGGDQAINKTDWSPLAESTCVFWPDNDEGSIDSQHFIATKVKKLYVIPIPAWKSEGWDAADAIIEEKWSVDDITDFIAKKVLYELKKPLSVDVAVSPPQESPKEAFELPGKLHGLCGEIADWINETAYKKQPILAIGGAIALVAAMKGQRVSAGRIMTNMYILGLGESGCGKDHSRQCIEAIAMKMGLVDMIIDRVASGTGLLDAVARTGTLLWQIDELGRVIGNLTGKNAGVHQKEIVDNLLELYSKSNTLIRHKETAKTRDTDKKPPIISPCLTIHAFTVPERFYQNLTMDDIIDGFMSRWMVICSMDPDPDEREVDVDLNDIPESILEKLTAINQMSTNVKISNPATTEKQVVAMMNAVNPKNIKLLPEAKTILNEYKSKARQFKNKLRNDQDQTNALWVRFGENATKLALVIQEGDYITGQDMGWACEWMMYWTNYSIDQISKRLSENEYDKRLKHLLLLITNKPGITKSALINYTKYGKKLRDELLDTLIEVGKIRQEVETTPTKKIVMYFPC